MSERCPNCGRERANPRLRWSPVSYCARAYDETCNIVRSAWSRGLREGVDIALSNVRTRVEWIDQDDGLFEVLIEDDEVHAELERRLSGKERGDD